MTETVTFLKIPVDLRALYALANSRNWQSQGRKQTPWTKGSSFDEGNALHHLLGETFGSAVLQPFRLMPNRKSRKAALYAYSAQSPDELQDALALRLPDEHQPLDFDAIQMRDLPTRFKTGRSLGFDIRLCPVRRTDRDGNRDKSREIDAFLHEALSHDDDKSWMANNNRTREAVYHDWLAERLAPAAKLIDARLAHFRRTRQSRKEQTTERPDAILQGTLEVTDTAAFAQLITKGVGRHKTYGFGMLLLRPPHRPPMRS